jgi:uncharacterized NAD-dependent epimerase/dehydratase family protein
MDDDHPPMAEYTALIEQLCAKRSTLVQAMAANPEQITDEQIRDLAALQPAFLAVEAEKRRAERETLHKEIQQRTSSWLFSGFGVLRGGGADSGRMGLLM